MIGIVAAVAASVNGVIFVSYQRNGNSFAMAISVGVGVLAYSIRLMPLSFA